MVAKRPSLSEESFLAHLFSPKKNALPTGLRARSITGTKGRKQARVNAYNKMSPLKQEVLKRSGQRDAFLRGEITWTDAKKALRTAAVQKGIVKPVRVRAPKPKPMSRRQALDASMAQALMATLRRAGKDYDPATVIAGSMFIQEDDVLTIDYNTIKTRARDSTYMMVDESGTQFNPYWYH